MNTLSVLAYRGRPFNVRASTGTPTVLFEPDETRARWMARIPSGGANVRVFGARNDVASATDGATWFAGDVLDVDGPAAAAGLQVVSDGVTLTIQVQEWFSLP